MSFFPLPPGSCADFGFEWTGVLEETGCAIALMALNWFSDPSAGPVLIRFWLDGRNWSYIKLTMFSHHLTFNKDAELCCKILKVEADWLLFDDLSPPPALYLGWQLASDGV